MTDTIVYTFGRFSGLHQEHKELVDAVVREARARNADHMIYPSPTFDKKKNPIPFDVKVDVMQEVFPYANINDDPNAKQPFGITQFLAKRYDHLVFVVGEDRAEDFRESLGKYIEDRGVPVESFEVISRGARDPDAQGMSGTEMRKLATNGHFERFWDTMPNNTPKSAAQKLYKTIRSNMLGEGLNEEMSQELKDKREEYVKKLKKNAEDFKDRYGADWESVMYATATKMAKDDLGINEWAPTTIQLAIGEAQGNSKAAKGSSKKSVDSKENYDQENKPKGKSQHKNNIMVNPYSDDEDYIQATRDDED